jgi:hypothetical protein
MNLNPPKMDAGSDTPRAIRQHAREIAEKFRQLVIIIQTQQEQIAELQASTLYVVPGYVADDYVY